MPHFGKSPRMHLLTFSVQSFCDGHCLHTELNGNRTCLRSQPTLIRCLSVFLMARVLFGSKSRSTENILLSFVSVSSVSRPLSAVSGLLLRFILVPYTHIYMCMHICIHICIHIYTYITHDVLMFILGFVSNKQLVSLHV